MSSSSQPTVLPNQLKERYRQLFEEQRQAKEEMAALRQADPTIEDADDYEELGGRDELMSNGSTHVCFGDQEELLQTSARLMEPAQDSIASRQGTHTKKRLTEAHEMLGSAAYSASPTTTATPGDRAEEPVTLNQVRQIMQEDHQVTSNQFQMLINALSNSLGGLAQPAATPKCKLIPQAPTMSEREDLIEYFQLFESTQLARETPEDTWEAVLKPLLNHTCRALVASLPISTQLNYRSLKQELLAEADSHSEATIKVFWEHKKKAGITWREEVAQLTKLARRCAPGHTPEDVRKVFVMEQVTQQLPRNIQYYVRERSPRLQTRCSNILPLTSGPMALTNRRGKRESL